MAPATAWILGAKIEETVASTLILRYFGTVCPTRLSAPPISFSSKPASCQFFCWAASHNLVWRGGHRMGSETSKEGLKMRIVWPPPPGGGGGGGGARLVTRKGGGPGPHHRAHAKERRGGESFE